MYSIENWKIVIKSGEGNELKTYSFETDVEPADCSSNVEIESLQTHKSTCTTMTLSNKSTWTTMPLPADDLVIMSPGACSIFLSKEDKEIEIGTVIFGWGPVFSLTEDQIAAIKSNPHAAKAVRLVISCNSCGDKIAVYSALERKLEDEKNGTIWYEDLPDRFVCGCGKLECNLTFMKKNMHALLFCYFNNLGEVSFTRMYEKDALELIVTNFTKLLDLNPLEAPVQKYIERNPILLYQFSPQRIFYKPDVMSKYQADIVILNHKKELILIELEKPGKKILTKSGGVSADLQHPIDQVTDWLHWISDHKSTFIDYLGLQLSDVTKIKGVVIIGRDKGYDPKYLRKLKWRDFPSIDFFTYDDLVNGLYSLIKEIRHL